MANIFDEIGRLGTDLWHGAEQLGGHGVDATKWLIKDMPQEIIDAPGRVNDELSRGLNKIGVRGWVGDNPLEAVGAAVAAVVGGAYLGPSIFGAGEGATSIFGGSSGLGAPVVEAVGQSPLDAILAGGGSAGEVGSISSGLDWGAMGADLLKNIKPGQQGQQQMQQQQMMQHYTPQVSMFTPTPIDTSIQQQQAADTGMMDIDSILNAVNTGLV